MDLLWWCSALHQQPMKKNHYLQNVYATIKMLDKKKIRYLAGSVSHCPFPLSMIIVICMLVLINSTLSIYIYSSFPINVSIFLKGWGAKDIFYHLWSNLNQTDELSKTINKQVKQLPFQVHVKVAIITKNLYQQPSYICTINNANGTHLERCGICLFLNAGY